MCGTFPGYRSRPSDLRAYREGVRCGTCRPPGMPPIHLPRVVSQAGHNCHSVRSKRNVTLSRRRGRSATSVAGAAPPARREDGDAGPRNREGVSGNSTVKSLSVEAPSNTATLCYVFSVLFSVLSEVFLSWIPPPGRPAGRPDARFFRTPKRGSSELIVQGNPSSNLTKRG